MAFGSANMGTVVLPRSRAGQQPKVYDCGSYGRLTRWQIAKKAGISMGAAWYRIRKLRLSGEALVTGTSELRKQRSGSVCKRPTIAIACKLVVAFPDRVPTWQEVATVHPMCRNAAIRWRAGLIEARSKAA